MLSLTEMHRVESERTSAFRTRVFPEIAIEEWDDWRWQQRNLIRTLAQIQSIIALSQSECAALERRRSSLPLGVTPYYATLIEEHPTGPIRRTVLPVEKEFLESAGEARDPLHEERQSPVPGLVHRYPNRVLFLVTALCSTYCRYCTRSRMVGNFSDYHLNRAQWEAALDYIRAHSEINDVLLSGGDPLVLPDRELDWLLTELNCIPHIDWIRIGSKAPAVLPHRITPQLCRILQRDKAVWMSLHFTHPEELTPETDWACRQLSSSGVPLVSQTVLLAGVNDSASTLACLFQGLVRRRVKPYYLYQCDPVTGSAHLRTSVQRALDIVKQLQSDLSGYAMPTYVIDTPQGGGKVPLLPNSTIRRDGDLVVIENSRGRHFTYPDPIPKA